jgi:hypothetical protein
MLGLAAVAALVFAGGSAVPTPQIAAQTFAQSYAADKPCATVTERLNQLPEDGDGYLATLFVHADWQSRPEEKALVEAWPGLAQKSLPGRRVKTFWYDERSPVRNLPGFLAWTPTLPTALIQRADGYVLYKNRGAEMLGPTQCDEPEHLFRHRRACPAPAPAPAPKPDVNVNVNTAPPLAVPDTVGTEPEKEKKGFHVILAVLCVAVAGIAGVFYFRKRVAGSSIVS